jgi:predicted RNA-binding Zn ribbon-like protein
MVMSVKALARSRSYALAPPTLIAGALCLDFVNTLTWRGDRAAPGERLVRYEELVVWAMHSSALDARLGRRLLSSARRRPQEAQRVLTEAIRLREALARLVAGRGPRSAADLALVNRMLAAAPARATVVRAAHGFAWSTGKAGDALDAPLWPVLWSAADLLTSARLAQVRTCADARCAWVFLDVSRNRSRRWCSMNECGNRAKVRRHAARSRNAGG